MKIDVIEDFKTLLEETSDSIHIAKNNIEINSIIEALIIALLDVEYVSLWMFDVKKASLKREREEGNIQELSMLHQKGVLAKSFLH